MRSGGDREDREFVINLESSMNATFVNGSDVEDGKNFFNKAWSGLIGCDGSNRGEEAMGFENRLDKCAEDQLENGDATVVDMKIGGAEKVVGVEKPKKKGCKKPPKPPRPPRPLSVDLADQKLIREISELAMLKRARIDRMRALKKNKNGKAASSSAGNSFALVITLIFCIVIFWKGVFSGGSPITASQVSPQPTETATSSGGFVSIQFYTNASTNTVFSSASPRNAEFESEGEQSVQGRGAAE